MWQSYRDSHSATFYFVFDDNRKQDDPLSLVVVDAAQNGKFLLTDKNNKTGNISEFENNVEGYMNYLRSKGVDTSIFKNIPKTEQEIKEQKELGISRADTEWFKGLSYEYKSKYIGRGHRLTDPQFNYLFQNNFKDLVNQYITSGRDLSNKQFNLIKDNNQMIRSYFKARVAMAENNIYIDFTPIELEHLKKTPDLYERLIYAVPSYAFEYARSKSFKDIDKKVIKSIIKSPNFSQYFAYHCNEDEIPEEIINSIASDPDISYDYAITYDDKRKISQKIIDAIATKSDNAWNYANHLKFKDIPESILDSVAKSQDYSYKFARILDFENIPKQIIKKISESPDYAYDFAIETIKKRGKKVPEEIIDGIASSYYESFFYAKALGFENVPENVVKAISNNFDYSYSYAEKMIKIGKKYKDVPEPIRETIEKKLGGKPKFN